jgi:hypothetical protein
VYVSRTGDDLMTTGDLRFGQPIGRRVKQLLRLPGDTPAAVVAYLGDHPVTGIPCGARRCLFARLLSGAVTADGGRAGAGPRLLCAASSPT